MTDYKAIFGKKIKFLTTDLSNAEGEGEIFYSDTDAGFKVGVAAAAWSAGSAMSPGQSSVAGCGIQTAGLSCGGHNGTAANVSPIIKLTRKKRDKLIFKLLLFIIKKITILSRLFHKKLKLK